VPLLLTLLTNLTYVTD
jgi:hypothetical protein